MKYETPAEFVACIKEVHGDATWTGKERVGNYAILVVSFPIAMVGETIGKVAYRLSK